MSQSRPAIIVIVGVVGITLVLWDVPHRIVLNVLPFTTLYGVMWLALSHYAGAARTLVRDLSLAGLTIACLAPTLAATPPAPRADRSQLESAVLWSTTLQRPDHVIEGRMRLPARWMVPGQQLRMVVRLADVYDGPATLLSEVNDVSLGALGLGTSGGDPRLNRELVVDTAIMSAHPTTTVRVRQSRPDPALRIVTFGRTAGATLGDAAAWFFDGVELHRGVVHPVTGRIVEGLPHIVLQPLADEIAP